MHVACRLYIAGYDTETPNIGELFWDPVRDRFGVYAVPANKIRWYPRLTDRHLALGLGQLLSGDTADGVVNDLGFDFSVIDTVKIISRRTGQTVASFSLAGSTVGSPPLHGGFENLVANAALSLRRNFNSATSYTVGGGGIAPTRALVAPNWQLWTTAGVGTLSATFTDDMPPGVAGHSLQVANGPIVNSAYGLRIFVHRCEQLVGTAVNASVWLRGPAGAKTKVRFLSPDQVYGVVPVVGSGDWQQISLDFTVKPGSTARNNLIAVDCLYNTPGPAPWKVAAPQLSQGAGLRPPAPRTGELEHAVVRGIYRELIVPCTLNQPVYVPLDLLGDWLAYEAFQPELPKAGLTVENSDRWGVAVLLGDGTAAATPTTLRLTAYRAPIFGDTQ